MSKRRQPRRLPRTGDRERLERQHDQRVAGQHRQPLAEGACTEGRPRRVAASSKHGRSSCTSEAQCSSSIAAAAASVAPGRRRRRRGRPPGTSAGGCGRPPETPRGAWQPARRGGHSGVEAWQEAPGTARCAAASIVSGESVRFCCHSRVSPTIDTCPPGQRGSACCPPPLARAGPSTAPAAGGYAWWYVDALSADGRHGLT